MSGSLLHENRGDSGSSRIESERCDEPDAIQCCGLVHVKREETATRSRNFRRCRTFINVSREQVHPHLWTSETETVTKAEIVDRIAAGTGLTKLETEAVVDGFIYTVIEALQEEESVELRGFGSFRVRERAARTARNPQTDELIEIPRRFVPSFKPSREFARVVNEARIAGEP